MKKYLQQVNISLGNTRSKDIYQTNTIPEDINRKKEYSLLQWKNPNYR